MILAAMMIELEHRSSWGGFVVAFTVKGKRPIAFGATPVVDTAARVFAQADLSFFKFRRIVNDPPPVATQRGNIGEDASTRGAARGEL